MNFKILKLTMLDNLLRKLPQAFDGVKKID